jgi:YYY domain-containing protein
VARLWLLAILVAGAILRWTGIGWDKGHHLHPDERYISMVEETLEFPKTVGSYFDSAKSPLNPYNRGHDSFVYGTLPMFMTKALGDAIGKRGYDGSYLVGRALSGFFDLWTVWLVYRIARRFGGRRAALLAAAFLAFCPLGIQLSHFWGVDSFLTTFSAATLLGCVRIAQGRATWRGRLATGVALGLAVACKITGLALFAPLGVAVLVDAIERIPEKVALPSRRRRWLRAAGLVALRFAAIAAISLATIRIFLPYVFLGWKIDPRYLKDMNSLISLGKSVAGFPPALQWAGRTVLFPLENIVLWGAAPFFGLAAIAGFVAAAAGAFRRDRRPVLPLLVFAVVVCAYHALSLGKSIRYFYPAYTVFAVVAGIGLLELSRRWPRSRAARVIPWVVVAGAVLSGIAFAAIYRRPVTRETASRWIYEHVAPENRFSGETWDDGLPFPEPNENAAAYAGPPMELWGPDDPAKVDTILKTLNGCDWIMITSNRVYGNITRLPTVFPMTTAYYRALFEGRLGFDRAADFTSYPSLGPLHIPDDRSEEAFTVYDHPRVLLFRKTAAYSPARVRSMLLASMPTTPPTIWDWEKAPRSQRKISRSIVPSRGPSVEKPSRLEGGSGGSWTAAILFYLAAALLGLLALPLTTALFSNLRDRGAGVARVIGIVIATYASTVLVQGRLLANGRFAAVAGIGCLALLSAVVVARRGRAILAFWRAPSNARLLGESEAFFAAGFVLFAGLRAWNPEIYWGEKPMDFSILNILVRTVTLPASDPWFAGAPLGYYTFGHESIALLSMLTGISTRYTFNLAFGLLGGMTLSAAYSLGRNWKNSRRAGAACATMVAVLGNLAGLREWLLNHRQIDWNYFWATSRVIPNTINEYPFWSLTFADLHAHVFSIPIFLLVGTCALSLVRRHAEPRTRAYVRTGAAAVFGAAAGAQALTNAWDVPLLAGLIVLVAIVAAFAAPRFTLRALGRAFVTLVVSAAAGLALVLPLWVRGGGAPAHGKTVEPGALGPDILTHVGLCLFLALAWWLVAAAKRAGTWSGRRVLWGAVAAAAGGLLLLLAWRVPDAFFVIGIAMFLAAAAKQRDPEEQLACGFIATAFFLILFTQHVYIYDRMNTFFKLYLEAWLLFAVATAVLVFRGADRRGGIGTWPRVLRAGAALLAAAAMFTTLAGARGMLTRNRTSLPDGVGAAGPSLDGLAYLERWHPGEYRAVLFLRTSVTGTPVVLEAQGPSYQQFGRISMLTGLPTVLGWDYHVQQRGNPPAEVEARRDAVKEMYSSSNAASVEGLLRRYHVGYVYVGRLERDTYPRAGITKFRTAKDLFQVAYENPDVTIYRVVGGDSEDVVLPRRESLPETPETIAAAASEPETPPEIDKVPAEDLPPWSRLKEPRGAAVDGQTRVWIADFGHSRLRVFDSHGGGLGGWGGRGNGPHGFNELCGVAIHGDRLVVADTWNGRIQAFDLNGNWKATVSELYGPRGVAIGPDGRVWAADTGNGRVMRYSANLTEGVAIGRKGSGPGEFSSPVGIDAGPSGNIYVADTGNRRIQVLDSDGAFKQSWPIIGWGEGAEPQLAVDADGTVYVTDPIGNALLELSPEGRPLRRLLADGAGKAFSRPTGLALDRKNRMLYVINSGNSSVATIPLPERKKR